MHHLQIRRAEVIGKQHDYFKSNDCKLNQSWQLSQSVKPAITENYTGWLQQQTRISHRSRGWRSHQGGQTGVFLGEGPHWVMSHTVLVHTYFLVQARELLCLFLRNKDTNLIMKDQPSRPNLSLITSQKPHLRILSYWGLGFRHVNFRGTQTFSLHQQLHLFMTKEFCHKHYQRKTVRETLLLGLFQPDLNNRIIKRTPLKKLLPNHKRFIITNYSFWSFLRKWMFPCKMIPNGFSQNALLKQVSRLTLEEV